MNTAQIISVCQRMVWLWFIDQAQHPDQFKLNVKFLAWRERKPE